MSLFAIGDTHLSFGADKPMDIFRGWHGYVDRLRENWERDISDEDTVVIAGDVSWGMTFDEALPDFRFLDELPGKKIILKGNHDYWWSTRKKIETFWEQNELSTLTLLHNNAAAVGDFAVCGSRGWFFDAGDPADKKVILREAGRLRTSIRCSKDLGKEPIVFLHYPPLTENAVCEEIYEVLLEEGIERCFYAHMHGPSMMKSVNSRRDGIDFSLISGDFLGFCPKLVEKF